MSEIDQCPVCDSLVTQAKCTNNDCLYGKLDLYPNQSVLETLIRKCLISLIINKGESYQRIDLLEEIEFMLEQALTLLPKETPCA